MNDTTPTNLSAVTLKDLIVEVMVQSADGVLNLHGELSGHPFAIVIGCGRSAVYARAAAKLVKEAIEEDGGGVEMRPLDILQRAGVKNAAATDAPVDPVDAFVALVRRLSTRALYSNPMEWRKDQNLLFLLSNTLPFSKADLKKLNKEVLRLQRLGRPITDGEAAALEAMVRAALAQAVA